MLDFYKNQPMGLRAGAVGVAAMALLVQKRICKQVVADHGVTRQEQVRLPLHLLAFFEAVSRDCRLDKPLPEDAQH